MTNFTMYSKLTVHLLSDITLMWEGRNTHNNDTNVNVHISFLSAPGDLWPISVLVML